MKKLDIVEEAKMSLDEKQVLLKQARSKLSSKTTKPTHLMLHEHLFRSSFSFRYRVSVAPGFCGAVFLTRFFADRHFNKLVDKYNLTVIDDEETEKYVPL